MNLFYILIGAGVLLVVYLIATYNGFVVLKTRIQEAFSGIDVQLKRRADLIPNLVETVKGYAKHERGVFNEVTKARSALMTAKTPVEKAEANNMLTGALKSLFAVAEAYPDLQAAASFAALQRTLTDVEDHLQNARRYYNAVVRDLNTAIQSFPSNLVAGMFGFQPRAFFELDAAAEREAPAVKF